MGKNDKERRVYPKDFKAEAVALAEKHEKPVCQAASDLGINEKLLYRWMQQAREAAQGGLPPFPGHGRPRGEELTRLRKEVTANEILKKRRSSSHKGNPTNGVPVHEGEPGPIHR
jgi:transposase